MGIATSSAQIIIREHAWKPIRGDVLLLGRQTMHFNRAQAIEMIRECGVAVTDGAADTGVDRQTVAAQMHKDSEFIRDTDFFGLLGVPRIRCLDHSDYEGADLIHDLNLPIPKKLEGIADFILDGSTLDNVFDPATALKNIARMLKPGGRVLSFNMASNHNIPYTLVSPTWEYDYFVANKFADCRVYLSVHDAVGSVTIFTPNAHRLARNAIGNLNSHYVMGLILLAEKGAHSTWDALPDQGHYRSDEKWREYTQNIQPILASGRPDICRSVGRILTDVSLFHPEDYRWLDVHGRQQPIWSDDWAAAAKAAAEQAPPLPSPPLGLIGYSAFQMLREVCRRVLRKSKRLIRR